MCVSKSGTAWILKHRVEVIFHAFYFLLLFLSISSPSIFFEANNFCGFIWVHFLSLLLSSFIHSFMRNLKSVQQWNKLQKSISNISFKWKYCAWADSYGNDAILFHKQWKDNPLNFYKNDFQYIEWSEEHHICPIPCGPQPVTVYNNI